MYRIAQPAKVATLAMARSQNILVYEPLCGAFTYTLFENVASGTPYDSAIFTPDASVPMKIQTHSTDTTLLEAYAPDYERTYNYEVRI